MRVGEPKQREEGEGSSQVRCLPVGRSVGRSGAAPPVIIRVTAARARLCAACTRRDVLPREKSEHLSVPPCRQQPPTSLSNSIQVVTRSPNSYFLSLVDSCTPTLNSSALLFLLCSLTSVCSGSLLQHGLKKGREMRYLNRNQFYVTAVLMHIALQSHRTGPSHILLWPSQAIYSLSTPNVNCIV